MTMGDQFLVISGVNSTAAVNKNNSHEYDRIKSYLCMFIDRMYVI